MDAAEDLTVDLLRRISALERRVAAVVRVGCVDAVQTTPRYRVRVNLGSASEPVLTGWVPVVIPRAGASVVFSPLTPGESVLLVAPGGNAEVSYALPALPSQRSAPHVADEDDATTYVTGDIDIEGDVVVDGALSVTGHISATGDISAEGGIAAVGDVVAGPGPVVRLLTHVHNPPLGGPPQRV